MAIRHIRIGNTTHDIYDSRITSIDSSISSESDNPVENSAIAEEFAKVAYTGDTIGTVDEIPDEEPEHEEPSFGGIELTSNKVTSLSSQSTDTQYPSAKCVYDLVGDIETLLAAI